MTIMVGNTIFGALTGEMKVEWILAMRDVMQKVVFGVGKSKPTSTCPYIFHLYHSQDMMRGDEIIAY